MDISVEKTEEHGCSVVRPICPEGWTVDDYYPSSSLTPWDYYGRLHQQSVRDLLGKSDIKSIPLHTSRDILAPVGSGSGGRVRFGDSMMPGIYQVAVPTEQADKATEVLVAR